jgi:hypothetical protein
VNEELGLGAPTSYDRAAALVEQLFEAPSDPECWQRMLAALGREISPDAVALVIGPTAPDGPASVLGLGPADAHQPGRPAAVE